MTAVILEAVSQFLADSLFIHVLFSTRNKSVDKYITVTVIKTWINRECQERVIYQHSADLQ